MISVLDHLWKSKRGRRGRGRGRGEEGEEREKGTRKDKLVLIYMKLIFLKLI